VRSTGQQAPRAYRSSRREEQARHTRRRVIAAATAVFLARGYAGATMRAIATGAGVSVPTVELLFGTKARVLKAAIDVAIAGDDEPVPVLDRGWSAAAGRAGTAAEFLRAVAAAVGPAQARAAGLVLAVLEGSSTDPELTELAAQLVAQRAATAGWIVDQLTRRAPLRADCTRQEAVDTVWVLMDPAVFDRLVRRRQWTVEQYQRWLAGSVGRLLVAAPAVPPHATPPAGRTSP
jgi:AcrR family transcriptional regulator